MRRKDLFAEIRPYTDQELPYAINRILVNQGFISSLANFLPGTSLPAVVKRIRKIKTCHEMQKEIFAPMVYTFIQRSIDKLTYGGFEKLDKEKSYLFIANHRDIILDSALLQIYLVENGLQTTRSAIGDNLLMAPIYTDLAKICNMFTVIRANTSRTMLINSTLLSEYIRMSICKDKKSVWIAQRNGRTKDGLDKTQQGVLKMLYSSEKTDIFQSLKKLNIVPVTISYEFEPCDRMKAREVVLTKQNKIYIKEHNEDYRSITTGIFSYKGRVHLEFGEPIDKFFNEDMHFASGNEQFQYIANLIDEQMYRNYKLFPNNYIAYDIRQNSNQFADKYTETEKRDFVKHLNRQANIEDVSFTKMKKMLLEIYANPVESFLSLDNKK
ncbi:MAG TPA: 1-acyl-sn-glycerol-3-phosphate acyltransferase [Bacteroidales bacterium]|nr:1-acyl-sn-glycerol-3-phosphate acyltransferase [Bacteroidales bacterium]HOR81534.1 1-acyl-sn-glycerol-3-phosphate acyltransferase [Bacteroidales bacterium]HPJ90388.1 1-acyl-sn-glycerol-3-phosphate acyltransferase [Bacteroidales bacterium]